MSFGAFIQQKRLELKISQARLAREIGVSSVFMCDVERGFKNAPNVEALKKIETALSLSHEERDLMYDLAGQTKGAVAPDLPDYIKDRSVIQKALRTSRDVKATDDEWNDFIERLDKRRN